MAEAAIKLEGISKRFKYNWIFRNIGCEFVSGIPVAIIGPNGSGKSTLMQVIAGYTTPSEGHITYSINGSNLPVEDIFKHISFIAPAMEVIEEMNLKEMLHFHFQFKKLIEGVSKQDIMELLGFAPDKEIRNYSSGMKQRLKLALAVFSRSSILLLDEPTTNLDRAGQTWYQDLISKYTGNRIVIVSSNQPAEYIFCKEHIDMGDFKRG